MYQYQVKELAQKKGWTQTDLWRQCEFKVSFMAIRRLWSKRAPRGMSLATLEIVATALGVTVEEMKLPAEPLMEQPLNNTSPVSVGV